MEQAINKFLQRLEKQEKRGFKDLATLLSHLTYTDWYRLHLKFNAASPAPARGMFRHGLGVQLPVGLRWTPLIESGVLVVLVASGSSAWPGAQACQHELEF